jgi:hypothetical protein
MPFRHASEIGPFGAKRTLGRFGLDVGLRDRRSGFLAQILVHRAFFDWTDRHCAILKPHTRACKFGSLDAPGYRGKC